MKATYHVTYRYKDWDSVPFGWVWTKGEAEFRSINRAKKFYLGLKKENKAKLIMVLKSVMFE